jgi:predicted nucleic acid-binding protein
VSRQVLHQYSVTATATLRPGRSVAEARSDVRALFHWLSAIHPEVMIDAAWTFQERCSLSFWDALMLGAAQSTGCGFLPSEDLPAARASKASSW